MGQTTSKENNILQFKRLYCDDVFAFNINPSTLQVTIGILKNKPLNIISTTRCNRLEIKVILFLKNNDKISIKENINFDINKPIYVVQDNYKYKVYVSLENSIQSVEENMGQIYHFFLATGSRISDIEIIDELDDVKQTILTMECIFDSKCEIKYTTVENYKNDSVLKIK